WLTANERQQVVSEWNETRADFPRETCLHQQFEQQTAQAPEAVALSFGERSLTYAELDSWANRVAQQLRQRGVQRGTLVALCFERSREMVAALLATLKAGAAFVPLDPASPAQRLRAILADTGAPLLLTQSHLVTRLPALEAEILSISEGEEAASVSSS